MTDLLIRDIQPAQIEALKAEANARGLSMQKFLQNLIEHAACVSRKEKAIAFMKNSLSRHKNNGLPMAEDIIRQMRDER